MMTIDECIVYFEEQSKEHTKLVPYDIDEKYNKNCKQIAEWLKELKTYREFADWLVKAVLEEDWEESADFYAEVLCRKLTKLGKLKVVDNKYMEVKDGDSN